MPLPIINLDDRRFEELAREARERLAAHTPEWSRLHPGDPGAAFIDLFAWLGETLLYRANLIPERQRRAFLNLLRLPLRPAAAARGVVSIDAAKGSAALPSPLAAGAQLKAGEVTFSTLTEIQPTWLELTTMVKEALTAEALEQAGVTLQQLKELYGRDATPFRPRQVLADGSALSLADTLDGALYLAFSRPKRLKEESADGLRSALAGRTLSVALAPPDEEEAEEPEGRPAPRVLRWELGWWSDEELRYLPLEVVSDGSDGGRRCGVVRLRLPAKGDQLQPPPQGDPQYTGMGSTPPELPAAVDGDGLLFWLRLTSPDEPALKLAFVDVNAVEVVGEATAESRLLGVGDNRPEQAFTLPHAPVAADTLVLEVEEQGAWVAWRRVEHFGAARRDDPVYTLDPESGLVRFGDGLRGRRVPGGKRVRARRYRWGGGTATNLDAGAIKELSGGGTLKVRHAWPTRGGRDGEGVEEAERRIPEFLAHRERAVTADDFRALALAAPGVEVARAEVVPGLIPGSNLRAVRGEVPGAVSLFVLPPGERRVNHPPRPSAGLLRDLYHYLSARRLVGTELYVLSPEFVDLAVSVGVELLESDDENAVLKAVEQAVVDYLWPLSPGGPLGRGWPLKRAVRPQELETQVARVAGVLAVNGVALYSRDAEGAWGARTDLLTLSDYQLPNLVGIRAAKGDQAPGLPRGLIPEPAGGGAAGASGEGGGTATPVPVITDIC